jgi:prepilin-type N-terminal cleavage/methylation domain-containing protein
MTTPSYRSRGRAFTLVELLTVLTIIGILSAITVPLIPLLLKGNQLDSSVNTLSGILEQARETAISANTYVWMAFTDAPANSPTGTWVATIQSQDGTETGINTSVTSTPVWNTTITVPGNNLQLLSKLQNLPGVKIVNYNDPTMTSSLTSQAPTSTTTTGIFFTTALQWTVTPLQNTSAGSGIYFTHALEFTPNGEAHVPTWKSNIQFGLIPTMGSTVNAVLFNVSRLTGKLTVYRP